MNSRTSKPIPLEIGLYIGERFAELGYYPQSTVGNLRIRFVKPQNLEVGQKCFYYWWHPYNRLPSYLEVVVSEVESETTYWYWVGEQKQVEVWPPGPGYTFAG